MAKRTSPKTSGWNRTWIHIAWLGLATLAVYLQVRHFDFVDFDDTEYIVDNPFIQHGLTWGGVRWAFTAMYASNWYPLTWLSLMANASLSGMDPGAMHVTNVAVHLLSSVILFLVLARATGARGRSAFVAGVFALHPLHVESVAWIMERKDVLSAFFWMLAMGAYVWYAEKRSIGRYAVVAVFVALGLMSKPMMVTLPCVLLLLDYWPLRRISFEEGLSRGTLRTAGKLALEKAPLFLMAAGVAAATLVAQRNTIGGTERYSWYARLTNAAQSYRLYLFKAFVPVNLRPMYVHLRDATPLWTALLSLAMLIALTYLLCWRGRRYPYLAVGWLWFLGTLVPVIGIVQVGVMAMADRYMYIPIIGVYIAVAWGAVELAGDRARARLWLRAAAAGLLVVFAGLTYLQAGYWRNTLLLASYTVSVEPRSATAYAMLGYAQLLDAGEPQQALASFEHAIELNDTNASAYVGMGMAYAQLGQPGRALAAYRDAVEHDPRNAKAYNNAGVVLASTGHYREAIQSFDAALKIRPDYADAQRNRARAQAAIGDVDAGR